MGMGGRGAAPLALASVHLLGVTRALFAVLELGLLYRTV